MLTSSAHILKFLRSYKNLPVSCTLLFSVLYFLILSDVIHKKIVLNFRLFGLPGSFEIQINFSNYFIQVLLYIAVENNP